MAAKKLILIVLAIFVLGIGAAAAQDGAPPHMRFRGGPDVAGVVHEAIEAASEATGLSSGDIYTQLADGVSLAEIVTANGGDPAVVVDAAVAAANERIDTALAEGRITDERAAELRANVEEVVTNAVNGDYAPFHHGRGLRGERFERGVAFGVLRLAAEQTGLDAWDIAEQVRGGTPLADVLTANGVDVDAFIEDAAAQADERLNGLVERGAITRERAGELLDLFREHLTGRIHTTVGEV